MFGLNFKLDFGNNCLAFTVKCGNIDRGKVLFSKWQIYSGGCQQTPKNASFKNRNPQDVQFSGFMVPNTRNRHNPLLTKLPRKKFCWSQPRATIYCKYAWLGDYQLGGLIVFNSLLLYSQKGIIKAISIEQKCTAHLACKSLSNYNVFKNYLTQISSVLTLVSLLNVSHQYSNFILDKKMA